MAHGAPRPLTAKAGVFKVDVRQWQREKSSWQRGFLKVVACAADVVCWPASFQVENTQLRHLGNVLRDVAHQIIVLWQTPGRAIPCFVFEKGGWATRTRVCYS